MVRGVGGGGQLQRERQARFTEKVARQHDAIAKGVGIVRHKDGDRVGRNHR